MRRRAPLLAVLVLSMMLTHAAVASASSAVSSIELVEHAEKWDGVTITFTGEVIGEAMERGDITWLHVNDDPYALRTIPEGAEPSGFNSGQAIIVPTELARLVTGFGDYDTRGDIVEVTGVFHAADPEHGGDMTIEASSLKLIEPARPVEHNVPLGKLVWLAGLASLTAASYVAHRLRRSHHLA